MTQGFYFVLMANLFGIVVATAYYFTMRIINEIKNKDLICIYIVSVAYTENNNLKLCEIPVGIMSSTPAISRIVFIQDTIRKHISKELKVDNSNPSIINMSYFGDIKRKELNRLVNTVIESN